MDQAVTAGMGNTYSDEILFQSRIHPRVRARALEASRARRLFHTVGKALRAAIARGIGGRGKIAAAGLPLGAMPSRWAVPALPRADPDREARRPDAYYCARCQAR